MVLVFYVKAQGFGYKMIAEDLKKCIVITRARVLVTALAGTI